MFYSPIFEAIEGKIKAGAVNLMTDYITALPVIIGVSIGVYALLQMVSSKLAKAGVIAVFLYGGIVVIA